jgi:hypothetical protein
MTPDILAQVRVLLAALGGGLVGKGIVSEEIVEAAVGLLILLIPSIWAWIARRPWSKEAIATAEKVAESDAPQASHIAIAGHLQPGQTERRNQ